MDKNYNLNKMVKIYIPIDKSRYNKSDVRGLFKSGNKIYYDYIKIVNYRILDYRIFYEYLEDLKIGYNQICIFYIEDKQGKIYYSKDKIDILPDYMGYLIDSNILLSKNIRDKFKVWLNKYGGFTIIKDRIKRRYIVHIYHNKNKDK